MRLISKLCQRSNDSNALKFLSQVLRFCKLRNGRISGLDSETALSLGHLLSELAAEGTSPAFGLRHFLMPLWIQAHSGSSKSPADLRILEYFGLCMTWTVPAVAHNEHGQYLHGWQCNCWGSLGGLPVHYCKLEMRFYPYSKMLV